MKSPRITPLDDDATRRVSERLDAAGIVSKKQQAGRVFRMPAAVGDSAYIAGEACSGSVMTPLQAAALKRGLGGGDVNITVVIPARNFTDVAGVPNRLFGSYINEEGEAC